MLHQGLMLPKVQYDTEQVYHYLRFEDQLLEPSDIPFLDKMIQGALDKQKYVFLDVNRFFIPVEEKLEKHILSIRPLFMEHVRVGRHTPSLKIAYLQDECTIIKLHLKSLRNLPNI